MKKKKGKQKPSRPRVEVNVPKVKAIISQTLERPLNDDEHDVLERSFDAIIARLARSQSSSSEKKNKLLERLGRDVDSQAGDGANPDAAKESRPPKPGHGRNGAADFIGATFIPVPCSQINPKTRCPECIKGWVYDTKSPSPLIRITGMPPIQATIYQLQTLRCNLCGQLYRAHAPEGVGEEKHDATVPGMLALLKYGHGMPWYRIEKLQASVGIPMPQSTQWELVESLAQALQPVHQELTVLAAQAETLTDDDTKVRILEEVVRPEGQDPDRTGLSTTGVVAKLGENLGQHLIALFTSGPQRAKENMDDLLDLRAKDLGPVVMMRDALLHNDPDAHPGVQILLSNCLTHGRRQFVDVLESFPEECLYVIQQLGKVYWHEEEASKQQLDPQARLTFHQEKSGPVMMELKSWMETQIVENRVEPNSGLGKAIKYFLKRWDRLTLFLRHPGAPLDSNVVERALKKAVLLRKNSLFYKTLHGAEVGDICMSIIHTCNLNGVDPFKYLTDVKRHEAAVRADPSVWLPWNYREQLGTEPPAKVANCTAQPP